MRRNLRESAMKIVASNKKAYFNYEIIESLEAGIALLGSEVKSIREGRISLKDSYAEIKNGEVFLRPLEHQPLRAGQQVQSRPAA